MWETRTILPLTERGAFKRIVLGLFILMLGVIVLHYGNLYVSHVTIRLEGREFGPMLFGSVFSVLVHASQVLPLLLAWVLIGRGTGYYFNRAELAVNLLLSSVGIWATWTALPLLAPALYYTFPMNVFLVVILVALFQLLTLHVENWIDKGTAMLLWVFSFQSLELLPSFPTNAQALSTLFQGMYRSNEEVAVASMAGTALFLSFMAGALTSTWLLARYSIRLGQVRQIWEDEYKKAPEEEREDGLREVNMVDMRSLVHDLKNPLAAIRGMALMLKEEDTSEKTGVIIKAADYMDRMISEILHEDRRRIVSVEALFDNVEKHCQPFPWGEYVTLSIDIEARLLPLAINEVRFLRALLNVLDNAWRANRIAGTKNIDLHVRKNARFVEIEVKDNGSGYVDSGPTYQKSGWGSTGLGLAFVRKLVTSHGGNILLSRRTDSENGTSVLISLPIATDTENSRTPR